MFDQLNYTRIKQILTPITILLAFVIIVQYKVFTHGDLRKFIYKTNRCFGEKMNPYIGWEVSKPVLKTKIFWSNLPTWLDDCMKKYPDHLTKTGTNQIGNRKVYVMEEVGTFYDSDCHHVIIGVNDTSFISGYQKRHYKCGIVAVDRSLSSSRCPTNVTCLPYTLTSIVKKLTAEDRINGNLTEDPYSLDIMSILALAAPISRKIDNIVVSGDPNVLKVFTKGVDGAQSINDFQYIICQINFRLLPLNLGKERNFLKSWNWMHNYSKYEAKKIHGSGNLKDPIDFFFINTMSWWCMDKYLTPESITNFQHAIV